MPRNLSESQLVQLSSKACSNVAGQFSKLGQSLNPNKAKTVGNNNATAAAQINPQVMQQSLTSLDKCTEAAEKATFRVGKTAAGRHSNSSSDSEEQDSSIYEPELDSDVDLGLSPLANDSMGAFKESHFLPSVGIVMVNSQGNSANAEEALDAAQHLETKDNLGNHAADLSTLCLNSVADNVSMPSGLLENAAPLRPITPNPLICVQNEMGAGVAAAGSCSSAEQSRSVFYK